LPRRNAQLSVVGSLSETAAFALGGWLYQGLGATLSLAVDAASYAVSALCLRGLREVPGAPQRTGAARAWRAMLDESAAGLRVVATQPALQALAGIEVLLALGMSMAGTSYTIFVVRDLGLPTGELGMIFALGGLGAALGASLAPRLGRRFGAGRTMALGLTALALGAACIPLAGSAGVAGWVAMSWLVAHQIVGDAGHTLHDVHDRTLRQTAVPAALLARADAGIRSAGQLATLVGAGAGGVLGTAFGARGVLWLVVAVHAAAAVLAALRLAQVGRSPAAAG
jgi:predicted MFS family arabinose efflux permease